MQRGQFNLYPFYIKQHDLDSAKSSYFLIQIICSLVLLYCDLQVP